MNNKPKDRTIIDRIRCLLEKADLMDAASREKVFRGAVSEYMEIENSLQEEDKKEES